MIVSKFQGRNRPRIRSNHMQIVLARQVVCDDRQDVLAKWFAIDLQSNGNEVLVSKQ